MTIPKIEQCAAILHAKEWDLAKRYCGGDIQKLRALLDVSREDLKEYLATHGHPRGWWWLTEETFDGLYLVPRGDGWVVYLQERGRCEYEQCFQNRGDALDFILDTFYLKKPEPNQTAHPTTL